jgi:hypothetical protein
VPIRRDARSRRIAHGDFAGESGEPWTHKNILVYTENFLAPHWDNNDLTLGRGAKTPAGPTSNSNTFIETATTAQHYIQQARTVAAGTHLTLSFYALAGTRSRIILGLFDETSAEADVLFHLNDGTSSVFFSNGVSDLTKGAHDETGGWYRVWLSVTMPGQTMGVFAQPAFDDTTNSYLGVPVVTALSVNGAQLERGSSMTTYSPRLAA